MLLSLTASFQNTLKCVKLGYTTMRTPKIIYGCGSASDPAGEANDAPKASWDRIESHHSLDGYLMSSAPSLTSCMYSLHLFSEVFARLVLCPQTQWVSAPIDPTGRLPFSRPLCRLRPCSCRSVLAYFSRPFPWDLFPLNTTMACVLAW